MNRAHDIAENVIAPPLLRTPLRKHRWPMSMPFGGVQFSDITQSIAEKALIMDVIEMFCQIAFLISQKLFSAQISGWHQSTPCKLPIVKYRQFLAKR